MDIAAHRSVKAKPNGSSPFSLRQRRGMGGQSKSRDGGQG
jgi:hypothetical protein